jgi:hypothetical protein
MADEMVTESITAQQFWSECLTFILKPIVRLQVHLLSHVKQD